MLHVGSDQNLANLSSLAIWLNLQIASKSEDFPLTFLAWLEIPGQLSRSPRTPILLIENFYVKSREPLYTQWLIINTNSPYGSDELWARPSISRYEYRHIVSLSWSAPALGNVHLSTEAQACLLTPP